ncbi:DUF58 domain-containing protein [Legionella worsleiensis]|uniref:DUF58 domain-containing protein n=1 Tax=Legionella worsleiensis TaxID=45076 RepID=A0A0W1AEQ0_9GAMM|nr:DUF58 domain-containing protein [Legionella worsleiensis]KTD79820.1 hypothetical protein Lwor_1334 [Legionella worsleiensis]STY32331.1 Uncharacterized conserved protein (some members contain a von Willebrand factor type A (vWA) domain) [Legionella worsleiensis]
MAKGVVAELNELIELRRYAQTVSYQPEGRALRSGAHLSKVRGRGMDFAEVRNYQAGDEIRHMEWRVTARTGRPHVKIYQEERERPVVILADFNPTMIFGTRVAFKSVIAARLAALLAWTVMKQGDRVGGFFFSATEHSEFIPRSRDSGVLPLLASLSQYTMQTEAQKQEKSRMLSDALTRLRRVVRPGSIVVLISDFYTMDAECEKHLNRLRGHNDVLAYHICDRIELTPPKPEQYAITNGQHELVLDTRLSAVSTAYEDYCRQRIEQLSEQFKRLHIQYVQATSETDLTQLVRQTFPRRTRG